MRKDPMDPQLGGQPYKTIYDPILVLRRPRTRGKSPAQHDFVTAPPTRLSGQYGRSRGAAPRASG